MTNPVFEAAKTFASNWQAAGKAVGEISLSENRFGQFSAYFDVSGHGRFRVSDHSANQNFRISERTVAHTDVSAERVARLIEIDAAAAENAARDRAAAEAERDAFEAPFKAKWLAAKESDRYDILCSMRPFLAADKAARKEITTRWLKG